MAKPKPTEEKILIVEGQIEKIKNEILDGQEKLKELQKERNRLVKLKDKEFADKLTKLILDRNFSDEERLKCLELFAPIPEQAEKEKKEHESFLEQKTETGAEEEISSLKENVQMEQIKNNPTIQVKTKQEPQAKTLSGLSFFRK